ncbi:MAG: hypothetical protein IIU94_07730, partial [Alistipes sp.]|nr:hypothetical protein [Alistipes sp.]
MKRNLSFVALVCALCGLLLSSCCNQAAKPAGAHVDWVYNSVVYEMNVRQQTQEGTFAAAEERLPHIHPAIIRTTFKILGKRLVMISDSLSCAGLPDGTEFADAGGHIITVKDGKATLADGTIAGSSTNLFECVRRNVKAG